MLTFRFFGGKSVCTLFVLASLFFGRLPYGYAEGMQTPQGGGVNRKVYTPIGSYYYVQATVTFTNWSVPGLVVNKDGTAQVNPIKLADGTTVLNPWQDAPEFYLGSIGPNIGNAQTQIDAGIQWNTQAYTINIDKSNDVSLAQGWESFINVGPNNDYTSPKVYRKVTSQQGNTINAWIPWRDPLMIDTFTLTYRINPSTTQTYHNPDGTVAATITGRTLALDVSTGNNYTLGSYAWESKQYTGLTPPNTTNTFPWPQINIATPALATNGTFAVKRICALVRLINYHGEPLDGAWLNAHIQNCYIADNQRVLNPPDPTLPGKRPWGNAWTNSQGTPMSGLADLNQRATPDGDNGTGYDVPQDITQDIAWDSRAPFHNSFQFPKKRPTSAHLIIEFPNLDSPVNGVDFAKDHTNAARLDTDASHSATYKGNSRYNEEDINISIRTVPNAIIPKVPKRANRRGHH